MSAIIKVYRFILVNEHLNILSIHELLNILYNEYEYEKWNIK